MKTHTTLIIAEKQLEYPFDLGHITIDSFEHLGKAIDYDEVLRFQEHLTSKVKALLENPQTDSPLYTILPRLKAPVFTKEEIEEIVENIYEQKSATDLVEESEMERKKGNFPYAIELLNEARALSQRNDFIIQKLALATYKSKQPNEGAALLDAEKILEVLNPNNTTDPETLGLSGAINKRLYECYKEINYLDKSLWFYERGFYIKQDYYNGINAAFLHTLKSTLSDDEFTSCADFGQGNIIRKKVIEICENLLSSENFNSREDKDWIYLTLAEAYFGIENIEEEVNFFSKAKEVTVGTFALDSYLEQKNKLSNLIQIFKIKYKKYE